MERAYSVVTITKSAEAERTVEGVASVPSVDRQGDIVEPKGIRWRKLANGMPDVPWLMQHRHDEPIGHVEWLSAKPDGLRFRARMPKVDSPPTLKERLDTAYAELATGLVRGISIGFMPLKAEPIDTGWRFKEISLYEISSVTIPACEEACVEVVKRYDEAARRGDAAPSTSTRVPDSDVHSKAMSFLTNHLWPVRDKNSNQVMYTQGQHDMITQGFMMLTNLSAELMNDVNALQSRLESIERKGLESPPIVYRGVWKPDQIYPRGCFATHQGSMWHCDKAGTDRKPGEGDWTLCVKRGADAR